MTPGLIERLEAAGEGSRELDRDLLEAADAVMPLLSLIEDDLWEDCPFPAVQRKRIAALRAAILKARATQEQG